MSEAEVTPLEGRDLIIGMRDILANNPERHDQKEWISNYYLTPDEIEGYEEPIPLDLVRPYMTQPMSTQPVEPNSPWPMCGSTGCAIGWGAVLSAPPGSVLVDDGSILVTPDGERHPLLDWVAARMGITLDQAWYIANPIRERGRLIRILDALSEDPSLDPRFIQ